VQNLKISAIIMLDPESSKSVAPEGKELSDAIGFVLKDVSAIEGTSTEAMLPMQIHASMSTARFFFCSTLTSCSFVQFCHL
jgi:hypothetical protein